MTDSENTPEQKPALGARVVRGAFWAYGGYLGARLFALVATAALARLLTPEEFGLVALALIFIAFADTFSDMGLGDALIISRDDEFEERAETVFVAGLGIGALLAALTAAAGPLAAEFFDEPDLVAVLPVLGATFLLRSLGMTHYALAQRKLDFRSRTAAELADAGIRGAVGISLAVAGLGAWALVLGYVGGSTAKSAVLWLLVRWRPRLQPRWAHLRAMIGFGSTVTLVGVIAAVMAQVDYIFVGRALGTVELGLYTLAYRLPELVIVSLSVISGQVLFPAFASLDREGLRRTFPVTIRYTVMLGLPAALFMVILAEPLVLALFGDQWTESAGAMRVLAVFAIASPVSIIAGVAYKAMGRADVLLKVSLPQLVVLVIALALLVESGIVAVAAAQTGVRITFSTIAVAVCLRMIGGRARDVAEALWPPVLAAVGYSGVLLAVDWAIDGTWPVLIAGGLLGSAVYIGTLWLVAPDSLRRIWALLPRPSRRAAAAAAAAERELALEGRR